MDDGENDVENQYYLAKGEWSQGMRSNSSLTISPTIVAEKEDDPEKALKDFRKIVDAETEKGEW